MEKIKLFSAAKTKGIEGTDAELYFDFYLVINKNYIFTFLIDSPNLSCSDRNPIRLWKHWLMLFEEEYVKYLRRYEKSMNGKQTAAEDRAKFYRNVLMEVSKCKTEYEMRVAPRDGKSMRLISNIFSDIKNRIMAAVIKEK